jgi:hypothetical protein
MKVEPKIPAKRAPMPEGYDSATTRKQREAPAFRPWEEFTGIGLMQLAVIASKPLLINSSIRLPNYAV